jgi:hypothetical protein
MPGDGAGRLPLVPADDPSTPGPAGSGAELPPEYTHQHVLNLYKVGTVIGIYEH